jgi:glycosyltransferase involved in cell wall biosynthesis
MRVAHVTSFRPGSANGVHAAAAQLGAALATAGVDVEYWHFRRDRVRVTEREDPSGVRVVELPFPGISRSRFGYARWLPSETRRFLARRAELVSLVHYHSIFQPEAWYLARTLNKPYAISPHGGYVHFRQRGWRRFARLLPWLLLERQLLRGACLVHAVSASDGNAALALGARGRVVVIPNGVEIPGAPADDLTLASPWLFVGRLAIHDKGLDLLVDGYAEASRRAALPRLVIRGPDYRGGRRWLAARIASLGLESDIELGDALYGREKDEVFAGCSLFVHPSRTEGLPVTPLEAMARSRPLAVTPGTNLAGPVAEAGAGLVIPEATASAVADTLQRAAGLGVDELRVRGARGRSLVERTYSWERVARELAELYDECAETNGNA